jgi:ribosomal protein L20A (L18A)
MAAAKANLPRSRIAIKKIEMRKPEVKIDQQLRSLAL